VHFQRGCGPFRPHQALQTNMARHVVASVDELPPGARKTSQVEQVLLGVIASKHGIGILDALTQGATGTA